MEIDAAFTEIVFANRLMYGAEGVRLSTMNGHTMA